MSLSLIRRLVLVGALSAGLLGAGLASAEEGDPPADAPVEIAAVTMIDPGPEDSDDGDAFYADPLLASKSSIETALTSLMSGCRSGLLATRVTVMRNDLDPSASYLLVTEIGESDRSMQEKLSAGLLESCFAALDASTVDKAMFDELMTKIATEMETLLAMS